MLYYVAIVIVKIVHNAVLTGGVVMYVEKQLLKWYVFISDTRFL